MGTNRVMEAENACEDTKDSLNLYLLGKIVVNVCTRVNYVANLFLV